MTLPRLETWADALAPGINQFGQGLIKKLTEDSRHEKQVRDMVIANPEMINQFAEMERDQPGLLESLKLPKLAEIVKKTPQTLAQKKNALGKKAMETITPDQEAEVGANALGIKAPRERKLEQQSIAINQGVIDRAPTELSILKMRESLTKHEAELAPLLLQVSTEEANAKLQDLGKYRAALPVAEGVAAKHGNKIFQAFRNGQITSEEMAAINRVPEIRKAYDDGFAIWKEESDNRYRNAMLAAQQSGDDDIAKINQRALAHWAQQVSAADPAYGVDPMTLIQFRQQPPAVQEAFKNMTQQQLQNSSPGAMQLWQAAQAIKSYSMKVNVATDKARLTTIDMIYKPYKDTIKKSLATLQNKNSSRRDKETAISAYNAVAGSINADLGNYDAGLPEISYTPGAIGMGIRDIVFNNKQLPDPILQGIASEVGVDLRKPQAQAKVDAAATNAQNAYTDAANKIAEHGDIEAGIRDAVAVGYNEKQLRAAVAKAKVKK
jgi:hypothetical protein